MELFDLSEHQSINLNQIESLQYNENTNCIFFHMISGRIYELRDVTKAHYRAVLKYVKKRAK